MNPRVRRVIEQNWFAVCVIVTIAGFLASWGAIAFLAWRLL